MEFSKDKLRSNFLEDVMVGISQGVITNEEANEIFDEIYENDELSKYIRLGDKMESYHDMFLGYDLVSRGKTYTEIFNEWKDIHQSEIATVKKIDKVELKRMYVYVIATHYSDDYSTLEEEMYRKGNNDYYLILSRR
ncbi:hypothetical protein [Exiguobacterium sp. SRB7LM]|uniref:hypothetical protein n=1 Tax=Exiguobacterium sp. SRB7LM TaxID=2608401 RepID=UPI0018C37B68|nr:hypothetical protein [Exiguobacterium sp. SRB7LM]MBG0916247.1 hypothetical protein [Exiguobacterium sp. SRB7LM]